MKHIIITLFLIIPFIGFSQKKGYEKSIEAGGVISIGEYNNTSGIFSMVNGYRFNNKLYIGIGLGAGFTKSLTGLSYFKGEEKESFHLNSVIIPVFIQAKYNFTYNKIVPFVSLNAGYLSYMNKYMSFNNSITLEPSVGAEFFTSKNRTFTRNFMPYQTHSIYFAFGFIIQKPYQYAYVHYDNWTMYVKEDFLANISFKIGLKF